MAMIGRTMIFVLLAAVALLADAGAAPPDADQRTLAAAGIEPTAAGIRAYLESLVDPALDKRVDAWIAELGSPEFAARERASLRLASLDVLPTQKLEAATAGSDPERAWRASVIVKAARTDGGPLLAALRVVEQEKLAVGLPRLLQIRSRTTSPAAQLALVRAMLAIVAESDRASLVELEQSEDEVLRAIAGRLLSRLDGPATASVAIGEAIDAVKLSPGQVSGGGRNLIEGWEFRPKVDVVATELGLFDSGGDGLASAHEIAIWDLEKPAAPLAQETLFPGQPAPLEGSFRFVPTAPVKLLAGRHYAIVALYPDTRDATVSLVNPSGLKVEYAEQIEPLGRRYAFPHEAMAFPGKLDEGAQQATHGPTFRYLLTAQDKAATENRAPR